MLKLKDSCNKEVFLVYNDEQNDEGISTELCVISSFMELVDHLKKLIPNIDYETKILHGILTNAFSLPKNLRGKTAFIIINDSRNPNNALILEADTTSDKNLVSTIMSILAGDILVFNIFPKIENMYILYGYEISTTLSLNEEDVDEEIIDTCQKIANDARTIESLTYSNGDTYGQKDSYG